MKKFIISILTVVIGVSLFSTMAFADASFNSPGAMPTVTVTNAITQPCNFGAIDGCWKTSTTANPGDIIAVHLYFKNTSNETATGVKLGIQPSRSGTFVTFNGGVAATNAPRATGTATVTLSQVETITSMPQNGAYQADWYPSQSSAPQPVNIDELYGTGFPVSDMAPGAQGVLVARFMVNGTATVTPPPTTTPSCVINNFSANPTSINLGSTSTLNWNTSNCNYVNITGIGSNLATDNNGYTVSPTNTTTYTLTAYPGGATATAIVTVNNVITTPPTNNTCTINSFTANPSVINSGNISTLNWNTSNCNYVNITPSVGSNLSASGNQSVYPASTTTYTLTAYPGGATATATVTVNAGTNNNSNCSINSFTVGNGSNSITINPGNTTTLSWNVNGASSISIHSSYGYNYTSGYSSGSTSISPYASTTYTLTPNGNNCSGSQSVYVNVAQQYQYNQPPVYIPQPIYQQPVYQQPVYQQPVSYTQPQAITTVANATSSYGAVLNGIAVPNTTYGNTNAWFEYGNTSGLGSTTNQQIVSGYGSNPYSTNISGLNPGTTYYYRAVVQNQNGIAYGSIVPFNTPAAAVYTAPTRVIVETRTVTKTTGNGIVAKSQASLFKLEVDSSFDHMCIGGNINYTVNYQNISGQDLQNSVLRITFPGELTYVSGSQGDYDVTDRTLTIALGDVQPGQQGSVTVNAQVNSQAVQGKLAVITATMVYTNPVTHAQEDAIAYSLITVSNDCPSILGAGMFGFGSFFTTLLEWLLLILIILAVIVLIRSLTRKRDEPTRPIV